MIELIVHDENRFVEVWLTRNEAGDEQLRARLKPICAEYKKRKYLVAVYTSGEKSLSGGMEALVMYNRERSAGKNRGVFA